MNFNIDVVDETETLTESQLELVQQILSFAADKEEIKHGAEVSVTFVSNQKITEINRDYRSKDVPTDVISFAMEELGQGEVGIIGENLPYVLGDIIISVEKMNEQAQEYEHSVERELAFLALHGFLHLLGYDHMNDQDERKMFGRQTELLNQYGISR